MTAQKQPEPIRLANRLEVDATDADMGRKPVMNTRRKAAAELRRLHVENAAKTKQINALQLLQSSQQSRLLDLQEGIALAKEAIATLQSERDANARLTAEVEKLRSRPALSDELLEALKYLMAWQVKHVRKWHNGAYDEAARVVAMYEAAHGIGDPT